MKVTKEFLIRQKVAADRIADMKIDALGVNPGERDRFDPVKIAVNNPQSLRLAINGFCCQCVGGVHEPGWRAEIRHCTSHGCALHHVRPYRQGEADSMKENDPVLIHELDEV
jgi:hypothetical protein